MGKQQKSTKYYFTHSAKATPTKQFVLVHFYNLCLGGDIYTQGVVYASPPPRRISYEIESPGALSFRRIFRLEYATWNFLTGGSISRHRQLATKCHPENLILDRQAD